MALRLEKMRTFHLLAPARTCLATATDQQSSCTHDLSQSSTFRVDPGVSISLRLAVAQTTKGTLLHATSRAVTPYLLKGPERLAGEPVEDTETTSDCSQ